MRRSADAKTELAEVATELLATLSNSQKQPPEVFYKESCS